MAGKAVAIDIGSHGTKVLSLRAGKNGLQVLRFCAVPAGEGARAVAAHGIPLQDAVCGLSGRDMTLRYSQVPPTPDWQLRSLMDLEIQDLAQQSGGGLSADYNLLPQLDPEAGSDTVLLALARDEALDRLSAEVKAMGGSATGFSPNCIAIYNAYLKAGPVDEDAVVCLVNIGHQTLDIALVKGVDLLFARNLSGGGKVLDDAIAAAFNVSERKAESLKRDLLDLDPASRGRYASGQAEKVTMAAGGAANAIVAGIQSSLAFCKTQTKIADLRLDKVLLCGGGSRLRGLRGLLREALRCPAEVFDPFANLDLAALPQAEQEQLQAMRSEAVVALGLAAARTDDSLYALEVVPAAVRKRQHFTQRTVWNIAAGLVGVVLLVLFARQMQADELVADGALRRIQRQRISANQIHDETDKLAQQNLRDRALVEHLATLAAPLHGAVRTAQAVRQHLPPQLWLKKFEVTQKAAAGAGAGGTGGGRRPVVIVEGGGKEIDGVDVGAVFLEFSKAFRSDPRIPQSPPHPPDAVTAESPPSADATLQFRFTIDWTPRAAAPAAKEVP